MTGIKVGEMAQEHRSAGRDLHQTEQQNPLTGWSREPSELSLPSPRNGAGHPDGAPRPSATAAISATTAVAAAAFGVGERRQSTRLEKLFRIIV